MFKSTLPEFNVRLWLIPRNAGRSYPPPGAMVVIGDVDGKALTISSYFAAVAVDRLVYVVGGRVVAKVKSLKNCCSGEPGSGRQS